jgi:hypothetical protein
MDDSEERSYRVRKRVDPGIPPGERLIGYLVPIVICALLGGAGAAFWHGSGGGGRTRFRAARAAAVTESSARTYGAIGAILGAIAGAVIARKSEMRGGRGL